MRPTDHAHPGIRRLVSSWLALTRQLFSPSTVEALAESSADAIKDTLFSLGVTQDSRTPNAGQTLPQLDASWLTVALRESVV